MDLDPQNIQKKDMIFMDFFSMYGKTFIHNKKVGSANIKAAASERINSGASTPFVQVYS